MYMRTHLMYELNHEQQAKLSSVLMEYLNANDWKGLFAQTDCEAFLQQIPSFYEDLSWEEENIEQNCADALNFILSKDPANLKVIWELPGVQTMTKRKDETLHDDIEILFENADDNEIAKYISENADTFNNEDFYCEQVLSGKFDVQVIFETELVLSFYHTKPYFEHHIVIIPKKHIDSLSSSDVIDSELAKDFMMAIHHVTAKLEKQTGGCRVSSNVGNYQTSKHLHWYVHAGKRLRDEDGAVINN